MFTIFIIKKFIDKIIPENHSLVVIDHANVIEMLHKHTIEIQQNHRIQLNMYPTIGWYNVMEALALISCSSIEMRTEGNQHHVLVDVDVVYHLFSG